MTQDWARGFEKFAQRARTAVVEDDPRLGAVFDVCANEARFGLSLVAPDVATLPAGAAILEIGAGILILSGYLANLGFSVSALEPLSSDFSHFRAVQRAVAKHFEEVGVRLSLLECCIEELRRTGDYQYAFSINVFEHIKDVEEGLTNAYRSLATGGILRVYCPNYHFPYEPHFNIPTLISKRLTGLVFSRRIASSTRVPFPRETWDSLNWINVAQVQRILNEVASAPPNFNRLAAFETIQRLFHDQEFRARRPGWLMAAVEAADRMGMVRALRYLPPVWSPVLDVSVAKGVSRIRRT